MLANRLLANGHAAHFNSNQQNSTAQKLTSTRYALTSSICGSYSTMCPATALAATVYGLARYIWPGPLRPGKLRFCALTTICSGLVETPGPALMQAPQLGSITIAPALLNTSR